MLQQLDKERELRIEIAYNETVQVKLVEGTAEIFGTEMAPEYTYFFSNQNIAIYTWHGCKIQVIKGNGDDLNQETEGVFCYESEETPMSSYLNAHLGLESLRCKAGAKGVIGPKVMVVGPQDSGKTSLCKILINYGVKMERKVLFVDIDTNEGSVSVPGTLTATPIHKPIDPEEEFGSTPVTNNLNPLAFYYGASNPLEKKRGYKTLCSRLAECVEMKFNSDYECRTAGFIMNTPSQFAETLGFELLYHTVEAFQVDVIFVLGSEKLYHVLDRTYSLKTHSPKLVRLEKSGGVVPRDKNARRLLHKSQIRAYFKACAPDKPLGDADRRVSLDPFTNVIGLRDVAIRRIGDATLAPSSALPLGADRKLGELQIIKVQAGDILLHSVLAVSHTQSQKSTDGSTESVIVGGEEQVLKSNILGFVYVQSVDDAKGIMTVLSPNPRKLGRRVLIMGDLKWIDT